MTDEQNTKYFDPELKKALHNVFQAMLSHDSQRLKENEIITKNNVFQSAVKHNREIVEPFVQGCLTEGSRIENLDNWDLFYQNFQNGQSSLILAEHKSNLDVVIFYYLMLKAGKLDEFDRIIFMAGRKLNEESVTVRLFAEMFNRLVVVPKQEAQNNNEKELAQIYEINYAAQQFLKQNRKDNIYLIYPTGTRSRIWEPASYEGITETINYIEKFDQIIFMSSDGNCMFPLPGLPMNSEPLIQDRIVIRFSSPVSVKAFIEEQTQKFHETVPNGNRQQLKSYLTKVVTQTIYSQKEKPPQEENWTVIVRKFLESNKNY